MSNFIDFMKKDWDYYTLIGVKLVLNYGITSANQYLNLVNNDQAYTTFKRNLVLSLFEVGGIASTRAVIDKTAVSVDQTTGTVINFTPTVFIGSAVGLADASSGVVINWRWNSSRVAPDTLISNVTYGGVTPIDVFSVIINAGIPIWVFVQQLNEVAIKGQESKVI